MEILENEEIESSFKDIFNEIHEGANDYDTLLIGIRVLEIARNRLDNDLDNTDIKAEYLKLNNIIKQLYEIKENYI